jgi:hypothetical protein
LKIDEAAYGLDHPDVARDLNNLAMSMAEMGEPDEAVALMQRAIKIWRATLGDDHPNTKTAMENLAAIKKRK